MIYRVEVRTKEQIGDPHAASVAAQIHELGIDSARGVHFARLFFLAGELTQEQAAKVADELLIDPVIEEFNCESPVASRQSGGRNGQDGGAVIEVHLKPGVMDPVAASTEQAIRDMGLNISSVRTARRYVLEGSVAQDQRESIARKLLANGVIEDVYFDAHTPPEVHGHKYELHVLEVPMRDLDDAGLEKLSKEGHLFLNLTEMKAIQDYYRRLQREPRDIELEMIAQTWSEHCVHKTFRSDVSYEGTPLPGDWDLVWQAADAAELSALLGQIEQAAVDAGYRGGSLKEHMNSLTAAGAAELKNGPLALRLAINEDLSRQMLVNDKLVFSFRHAMDRSPGGAPIFRQTIRNMIKNTIFAATGKLAKPWCISVFKDNAGVIEFDDANAVCFKVETHNHPSAIEPYGGASTGIGGVIRDPMGTGLGARPVANTDVFCFGRPDMKIDDVPKGVLHPRRVMRGVVAGVRDYGNRMGIPTVNGAVYFDDRYLGNPLVFCGTVGMIPRDKCFKEVLQGDAILVVGGRTGRDGIHGATFSSGELTSSHETEFSHAVQIGNAITEKKTLDTILQARDENLYNAITDCGAGGLSSAVGEMGELIGATVRLDRVPLKYAGLSYDEIWISEAQERMVLAVPQDKLERILHVFESEGVEATVIGTFGSDTGSDAGVSPARHAGVSPACGEDDSTGTGDCGQDARLTRGQDGRDTRGRDARDTSARDTHATGRLRLLYGETVVGELDMDFLHNGLPRPAKTALWQQAASPSPVPPKRDNYNQPLLLILASPNVASKEWIIRQYDHEVQGGSVIKPLIGVDQQGPSDAAVIRPVLSSKKGIAIACGMNPRLGEYDPYRSALHAVDEAMRNILAVGGNLEQTAILDNFCWGNCNKPDRMGSLLLAAKACHDAAMAYGVPFISGKDSLNNEFQTDDGRTIAIPPTLLISGISVLDDVTRCITSDLKEPGNALFILGRTAGCLGGSHYLAVEGLASGTDVPAVDMPENLRVMKALQAAIQAGLVRSCHDLSEGGLAVAAAEMAFAGMLGIDINIAALPVPMHEPGPSPAALLFGESAGRFLVEVAPDKYDAFLRIVKDCPFGELGRVTATDRITIKAPGNKTYIDVPLKEARSAWQGTFKM